MLEDDEKYRRSNFAYTLQNMAIATNAKLGELRGVSIQKNNKNSLLVWEPSRISTRTPNTLALRSHLTIPAPSIPSSTFKKMN